MGQQEKQRAELLQAEHQKQVDFLKEQCDTNFASAQAWGYQLNERRQKLRLTQKVRGMASMTTQPGYVPGVQAHAQHSDWTSLHGLSMQTVSCVG